MFKVWSKMENYCGSENTAALHNYFVNAIF